MRTIKSQIRAKTSAYHLSHPNQPGRHNNKDARRCDFIIPTLEVEQELWNQGYKHVCGLDEAGRGALAGPLVCAAVILPNKTKPLPFRDSKDLKSEDREKMFEIIKREAVAWSAAEICVSDIDKFGIQTATYLAFNTAIKSLGVNPHFLLIDYYRLPATQIKQRSLKYGDRISMSIAAASIVAKVTRDKIMIDLGQTKVGLKYDLGDNLGYGTKNHKAKINKFGMSANHRKNFCKFDFKAQKSFNF